MKKPDPRFIKPTSSPWDELEELIKDMDIPEARRMDIKWMARNLGINNSNHPNFEDAAGLIRRLLFLDKKEQK